jgi:hypothetical protein
MATQDANYPGAEDDSSDQEQSDTTEKDESQTALLPKSFFGSKDLKPGHKCTVEIVRLFEDEAEVKYLPESKEESGEKSNADAALESMATEKM